jgi:hypothetical protein
MNMAAKWKKGNSRFKPEVVLSELAKARMPSLEGEKPAFSAIEFHQLVPVLHSMLLFPEAAKDLDPGTIITAAVSRVEGALTSAAVLEAVNKQITAALSKKRNEYRVLTSISLSNVVKLGPTKILGATLRFYQSQYPPRLLRERAQKIAQQNVPAAEAPANCVKVVVTVRSTNSLLAFSSASRALDLYRAVWCLSTNSAIELFGHAWKPINEIRTGGIHTVHGAPSADDDFDQLWFEPYQANIEAYRPRKPDSIKKYVSGILQKLRRCPYSSHLEDALVIYVRALDEWNQTAAFTRLWTALERLTSPEVGKYDLVVRRVAFLFSDTHLVTQTMEHLREVRNNCIHNGEDSPHAKTYCLQLQNYFRQLVLFHIRNSGKFTSLDEINAFLDLPTDREELAALARRVKSAQKYRMPSAAAKSASE